jgi:hypothetical protein
VSRTTMSRRIGSLSAEKTRDSASVVTLPLRIQLLG